VAQFPQALRDRNRIIAYAGDETEAGNKNSGHAWCRVKKRRNQGPSASPYFQAYVEIMG
jgi:hypothetical protein